MTIQLIIGVVVGLVLGAVLVFFIKNIMDQKTKKSAEQEAERIIQKAKSKVAKIEEKAEAKAQDFEKRARRNVEADLKKERARLKSQEQTITKKQKKIQDDERNSKDKMEEQKRLVERQKQDAVRREEKAEAKLKELEVTKVELQNKLESVAQITQEQAKSELITSLESEAKADFGKTIIKMEEEAKEEAEKKAKRIISLAVSRYAGEYAAEKTTSVLALPSEDLKGKVIGKEGRNIRAFESICGVDLILDEVPDAVVISGFDPVRREVAKRSLDSLFGDGRIHPATIEQTVNRVKKDLFKSIRDDGDKACIELGITGVNKEILNLLGSLKYRTSYTQNNYYHSIETGFLCGMMAAEMGENVKVARRAGLMHDIGKALDHSIEGSHAVIGADFAKRHGEKEAVCHAIRAHHDDEKPNSVIAHLVTAADALSSARPGARKATQANYIKRLEDLETIGNSFDGVIRTFAVQAGREIRVVVDSGRITDEQSVMLSRDIAKKISREMNFPGQIKVTVLRELRSVEHAR